VSRFKGAYGSEWKAIARRVKDEAGNQCVRCAHPHDPSTGYCLTVHHADGDKANNAWWNLLALCQRCHLSIQTRVIPERVWLFEHSPWFVPYVVGFYASYYGGLNITRAEADANPLRYLAMGQPHLYPDAAPVTFPSLDP
jgi:hypothetical protein